MQRCLDLALSGAGGVAPNPMVGAVLVYAGNVIGEGYHRQYGGPHAEVNCINSVSPGHTALISKSTLYVSLEPCSHFGKTPPCTNLIIEKKIPEVVIGCQDLYDEVNGKGIEKLKAAGVKVIIGVMEKESIEMNKRFFMFHREKRPYIILKWAQSSDGQLAAGNGERTLISNEYSNRLVHKWRTEEATIMVGTNTALQDDPALTARLWPGKDPVRIVLDMELKLPLSLQLFNGKAKTIVFNQLKQQESEMLVYHKVDAGTPVLPQILTALYQLKIQSVLVEGGAKLLQSFIDADLWDEVRIISNESRLLSGAIGNGVEAPVLKHHQLTETHQIETDIISIYQHINGIE